MYNETPCIRILKGRENVVLNRDVSLLQMFVLIEIMPLEFGDKGCVLAVPRTRPGHAI